MQPLQLLHRCSVKRAANPLAVWCEAFYTEGKEYLPHLHPPPQLSVLVCSSSCCTAQPLQNTHMQSRTSGSRAGSPPTGSNCFPQVWQDGCICLKLRICLIRDGWGAKNAKMTKDLYRKNINYSFNSMDMYVRVLPFNRWRYLIGCHFRETQRDNVSHVKV